MNNITIDLYNFYIKELSPFKLAFDKRGTLVKVLISFFTAFTFIFYIVEYEIYKVLILIGYFICLIGFFIFIKYRIIKKNEDIAGKFDIQSKDQLPKIYSYLLMDFIYKGGLLYKEGLEYLITICTKRSNKSRFQGIAISVIFFSAIVQSIVDFFIFSEQKDWNRIDLYLNYFKVNSIFILAFIITGVIFYIILKMFYNEIKSSLINRKSNNHQQIADYIEEKILPLVLKFSYLNNRELIYKCIIDSIRIGYTKTINNHIPTSRKVKLRIKKRGTHYRFQIIDTTTLK